jgi:hypothetical protein
MTHHPFHIAALPALPCMLEGAIVFEQTGFAGGFNGK